MSNDQQNYEEIPFDPSKNILEMIQLAKDRSCKNDQIVVFYYKNHQVEVDPKSEVSFLHDICILADKIKIDEFKFNSQFRLKEDEMTSAKETLVNPNYFIPSWKVLCSD